MQTNKTLRWIALCGIFILPFIFFWDPSGFFFPFITGKNFAFRIIVEIVAVLVAILALRDERYRPKRTWISYAYAAFLVILILADIAGLNPARSFWSNSERMDGLITQLHLFLYFLAACALLSAESLWEIFLKTSIGASVIMCYYGIAQHFGWDKIVQSADRVDAKFGNATYLAVYLLFHIFFILYFLLKDWKIPTVAAFYGRLLLIPALVLECFVLYLTATRGDVLGVGFGVLLAALIISIGEREHKLLRKISIGIIAAAAIVVFGFIAVKDTSFVRNNKVLSRFASISISDDTTKARIMVWGMAVQGFEERPILGWGQENFNLVFSKYYNPQMYGQEPWFDRAHNVFFDWLISGGILGLLGYLALFAAGIWTLFRNPRFPLAEKAILTGLFAGYFFQNLFVFDNIGSYFMFATLLAFVSFGSEIGHSAPQGNSAGYLKGAKNAKTIGEGIVLWKRIEFVNAVTVLIVIAASCAVYFLNVPQIEANQALIRGLTTGSLPEYQKALSYGTFADSEIREQLVQAALASVSDASLSDAGKLQYINLAIVEMKKQIADTPLDVRTKILDGSLLNRVGLPDDALAALNDAKAMSPKKQQIYFELAEAYLQKKDNADALDAAKTAYELAPQYRQAASIYASVAIYAGKQAIADEIFKAYPDLEATDESVLQTYASTKQYAKVAAIWKIRFAKNPENPDLHVSYAGMLASFGQKQAAAAELRSAIAVEDSLHKDATTTAAYDAKIQALMSQI